MTTEYILLIGLYGISFCLGFWVRGKFIQAEKRIKDAEEHEI